MSLLGVGAFGVLEGDLDEMTTQDEQTYREIIGILAEHVGEAGESEGAVDVLRRLVGDHRVVFDHVGFATGAGRKEPQR